MGRWSHILEPCCPGTPERMKLHRQHMLARLHTACQGHTHAALCWLTLHFLCHYMVHLRVGKTTDIFPFVTLRKCSSPPIYIYIFPTYIYVCIYVFIFPLRMSTWAVRQVPHIFGFSLGRNFTNWPYSSKCTDASLMFRHDDIIHMLNFQGHASVLCWNEARVLNTCQVWIFDRSAHTLYHNRLVSFTEMEVLTFCLVTF